MENLEKAIAYTNKKKIHQLKKNSLFYQEPKDELQGYLDDEEYDSSVGLNFDYLANWYLWQFINNYVNDKELRFETLSSSTTYAIEANNWDYALGKIAPTYHSAILFQYSTMHLGQLLYLGWVDQAEAYGILLIKMLYSKHYSGGVASIKYPWFIITMFCKWKDIKLDKSKLNCPEDMGVYRAAIDNWDTADTNLLDDLINQLCEYHIKQSDENVTTDEYGNESSPEFTSSDYFIFPVEILTWLAIRKQLALPAYEPKHELMRLEINQLPNTYTPLEEDELVVKCKEKLIKENPGLIFELDIIPPDRDNRWNLPHNY